MTDPRSIALPPPERGIYCNRTLNLRSIEAIGFDMDYTLVHYHVEDWERRAYEHARDRLLAHGWPVGHLEFDPEFATLGLILDLELGNIVKADRFGYVKRACHGTNMLSFDVQRKIYGQVRVDLAEGRWEFMNTLFGLSEACLYSQLVELLDAGTLKGAIGYTDLYRLVRKSLDATHMEGALKQEILNQPERFVVDDPELPLALLDLKHAGKRLLLITNSEWHYTQSMMAYAFDRYLPAGTTWRDLFELVIVMARKPSFFEHKNPAFEVVDDGGLLRPFLGNMRAGGIYLGGNAALVESSLGLSGGQILYVGDHIFADVHVSKNLLRWRTALVVREMERDLATVVGFKQAQADLTRMMDDKERLEHRFSLLRIGLQRLEKGYGPQPAEPADELRRRMNELRSELVSLDEKIAPLARQASELSNPRWGLLMRAGNDKSHLARQIERYADVYMSRVSNLLLHTPFVYLRSPRGSLPHDHASEAGS